MELMLFHQAASKTYLPASFQYVKELSQFDNTFLTYGSDYMISIAMAYQIFTFPKVGRRNAVGPTSTATPGNLLAWALALEQPRHPWYSFMDRRPCNPNFSKPK